MQPPPFFPPNNWGPPPPMGGMPPPLFGMNPMGRPPPMMMMMPSPNLPPPVSTPTYQSTINSSSTKISLGLASQLVRDRLGNESVKLSQLKVKIFDAGMGLDSTDLHQMVESLGAKTELIPPHLLSLQLEQLPPDQIVSRITSIAYLSYLHSSLRPPFARDYSSHYIV